MSEPEQEEMVDVKSDQTDKNTILREHDARMPASPEIGYSSFNSLSRNAWLFIIIFGAAIVSSAMLSTAWFTVVGVYPSDRGYFDAQRNLLVAMNSTNATLVSFDLQSRYLRSLHAGIQGLVIGLTFMFVRYIFTRFTGETQDAWLLLGTGISEMIFHDEKYKKATERFGVIVKMIVVFLGFFIGWLIGYLVVVGMLKDLYPDTSVAVSNCTAISDGSVGCRLASSYSESEIPTETARWIVCIALLFIYVSYYMAYTMIPHKERDQMYFKRKLKSDGALVKPKILGHGSPLTYSIVSSLAIAAFHMAVARSIGSRYNIFYYLVTTAFTKKTEDADVYAWPGLIIIAIIVVIHLIVAMMTRYIHNRKTSSYEVL